MTFKGRYVPVELANDLERRLADARTVTDEMVERAGEVLGAHLMVRTELPREWVRAALFAALSGENQ